MMVESGGGLVGKVLRGWFEAVPGTAGLPEAVTIISETSFDSPSYSAYVMYSKQRHVEFNLDQLTRKNQFLNEYRLT